MKIFEVGRACFIGGVTLCLVALLVAPAFWWLGIVAGFASGYIAYEFREVFRAIPEAIEVTKTVGGLFGEALKMMFEDVIAWFRKQHPFIYPPLLVAIPLGVFGFFSLHATGAAVIQYYPLSLLIAEVFLSFVWGAIIWVAFFMLLGLFVVMADGFDEVGVEDVTYRVYVTLLITGARNILRVVCWGMWKRLAMVVWTLIRLIHSNERVLCGVDGTLGGLIALWAFWNYASTPTSFITTMFVALCGGVIGTVLGIANWELISKRFFGYGNQT
jgi:hypothetical protein